jgi:hypothetical protein
MKKLIPLIIFLLSCNENKIEEKSISTISPTDSVLLKSSEHLKMSDTLQKKLDSTTQKEVKRVVKQIQFFTNEIEKYKIEKITLLRELNVAKMIVRVDTVFIETKKNFWGKEKTNTIIKSDSQSIETTDSTLKSIDTTNHQY